MQPLKEIAKRTFPGAYSRYVRWQHTRVPLAERVRPVLQSPETPQYHDSDFDRLQNRYSKWWDEYEFDSHSTWMRGYQRSLHLVSMPELRHQGLSVFEAGCGDGMTGCTLASYGHRVLLNDEEDWRDPRAKHLPFVQGDVCGQLPLPADSFDLLVSYNTFEHVTNPRSALSELVRLCKKGGRIYLEFAPLFCSPLGLHAWSFLMPYPQFLFSSEFIAQKIQEIGVSDLGQVFRQLQPTNRWRVGQFRELWHDSGCELLYLHEPRDFRHLQTVMDFPSAFCGRELTVEDLTVTAVGVMLRKR